MRDGSACFISTPCRNIRTMPVQSSKHSLRTIC
jgi:hypothetical protein